MAKICAVAFATEGLRAQAPVTMRWFPTRGSIFEMAVCLMGYSGMRGTVE
ncbi:hypothetical protein PENANT_c056G01265 [Penicillium antarcticum]|uniref:Uncharacterized protein n=1 Tax=Penicillium antarcticum TaxID=416450 RepID=A0A1V6PRX2_9EURO|nr:hypothetical protein PENANT_c056G01265 [Penicillium antarcticum]